MPTITIPKMDIEYVNIAPSPDSNPTTFFLVIDGVNYSNFYFYDSGGYQRYIFPTYNSSTGYIQLGCITLTYGSDAPAQSFSNIEVYTVG